MFYYKFNRSLSPHLLLYKSHITSITSIFHRITGFVCSILLIFCPLTFVVLYSFFSLNLMYLLSFYISSISNVLFYLLFYIFVYHIINGIRHILCDFSIGLNIHDITIGGFLTFFFCVFLVCYITTL